MPTKKPAAKPVPKPKKAAKKAVAKPKKNLTKPDKPVAVAKNPELALETRRRSLFVKEYLVDMNGGKAAIRAGYSAASARSIACELLAIPSVRDAIDKAMEERAQRTGITADKVLERMWAIATAQASELIELRRGCCRYCWGKNHRYQWTPSEMSEAIRDFDRAQLAAKAKGEQFPHAFDEGGGIGFDPRKDPSKECPECFGQGVEVVFPKDTRDLSPEAKLLYAGVKTTQHGLEIKTHDQASMLVTVGKHLGMFKEKVEVTGKDGKPLEHVHTTIGGILDALGVDGADTGTGTSG